MALFGPFVQPNFSAFRPPFLDDQPSSEPQRRGGRGNRGYPRFGGRGDFEHSSSDCFSSTEDFEL